MKRFTMKRITALALALIMTLSLCPIRAEAATYEAQWGLADGTSAPSQWTKGTLAAAVAYANEQSSTSTAYIKLLENLNTKSSGAFVLNENQNAILDLNGKSINRNASTDYKGRAVVVYGNLTLCDTSLNANGKITGGVGTDGGGVYVNGGSLTMLSGSISGNRAHTGYGGGVGVKNGSFVMSGGSIDGNTAYTGGGGVYLEGSAFTMSGGFISNNGNPNGAYRGLAGGVYVDTNSTFTMSGGTISDNFTYSSSGHGAVGGGVYNVGTFVMSGGTITGNNAGKNGGGVYTLGTFEISGTPIISNNTSGNNFLRNDNVFVYSSSSSSYTISVTDVLSNTTPIGITMENPGVFAKPVGSKVTDLGKYIANFVSDDVTYDVFEEDNNLKLAAAPATVLVTFNANGGSGTMTSQMVTYNAAEALSPNTFTREGYTFTGWNTAADGSGTAYADQASITTKVDTTLFAQWKVEHIPHHNCGVAGCSNTTHGHTDVDTWTKLTSADLASGTLTLTDGSSYYLGEDITVTAAVNITGTVNLCLNGKTLKNEGGDAIEVGYNENLVVCDCSGSNAGTISGSQRGINCANLAELTIYGGTVSGRTGISAGTNNDSVTVNGGVVTGTDRGIELSGTGSTVTVNDGTVSGKTGIYAPNGNNSSEVHITGGTITGTSGSGVFVSCKTTISGGTISGTTYGVSADTNAPSLSGAPAISGTTGDIKLNGVKIKIADKLTYTESNKIGVTMTTPGVFTDGWSAHMSGLTPTQYFTSDVANFGVVQDGSELKLELAHAHPNCGVAGCSDTSHGHTEVATWTKLTQIDVNNRAVLEDGNYYLCEDITAKQGISIMGTVSLCLNGHTLESSELVNTTVSVAADEKLVICDCSDSEVGRIEGISGVTGYEGSSVTIYGGTIAGSTDGIRVYNLNTTTTSSDGTAVINGGVITGGRHGIAVSQSGSTLTVNGGEISGGSSGISALNNTTLCNFNINGGIIRSMGTGIGAGSDYGIKVGANNLSLSGAPVISGNVGDIQLGDSVITISDALTYSESNKISVKLESGAGVFTSGWSTKMSTAEADKFFTSADSAYKVVLDGGELKLAAKTVAVSSVTLNKNSTTIAVGGTEQLTATVLPDNATDKTVIWSSNATNIATVDSSGKVTAKNVGTATITASAGGKSATCTVTVYQTYPLWVGGVPFTSNNLVIDSTDISGVTGNATYDPATKTLTLNGFSLNYSGENAAIYVDYPLTSSLLTINLVGDNTVTNTSTIQPALSVPKLNITGSGKLTAQGGLFGISGAEITISSGTVTAISISNYYGIHTGNYVIIEGGEVTAKGGVAGISSRTVIIKGGTVTADSMQDGIGAAEFGSSTTYEVGVFIEGGTVTATGGQKGINAASISVSGGTVTAKGNNCAMNTVPSFDSSTFAATASTASDGNPMGAYVAADLATYKYIKIEPHTHSYTYSASGNEITESCTCYHSETATIAAPTGSLIYNGSAKEATVSYSDGWVATKDLTVSYDSHGNINAGAVTASITKDSKTATVTYGIERKAVTVTADDKTMVYGGTEPTLTYVADGLVSDESLTGDLTRVAGDTVGTYDVTQGTVTNANNPNYNITFVNGTLTVEKKEIGIAWGNTAFTYDGSAQAPTATATGVVNSDVIELTVVGAQTNVGSYTATVTGITGEKANNYKLPSNVETSFTVGKTDSSCTVPAAITGLVYTGNAQNLVTAATATGGTVQYSLSATGIFSDAIPVGTDAGTYTVYYKVIGDDNHNDTAVLGPVSVIIAKQQVTKPTADSTVFTYTGVAQIYSVATSTLYEISNETQTNAGDYTVIVALKNPANYEWDDGTTDNLTFTFSIAKASLTVTANAKTITYGDAPANAGVSYTGFVNGETADELGGELSYSYDYAQYGNVGNSYTITPAGLTSDNYAITFEKSTLTVEKKEIGIAWGNTAFTYDGSAQAPTATATGVVNSDVIELTVVGAQTNVGSYTATVTASSNSNYKLPASVTTEFTIAKADQTAPDVGKIDESISNKADGAITGVTSKMEYSTDGTTYTAISGDKVENLAAGVYYVRVKGDANHNPSPVTEVIIREGSKLAVTYIADGVTVDTVYVDYGATAVAPAIPAKEGYTSAWDKASTNITADTVITAVYTINKYTVSYKADGVVVDTQTVEHGADAVAPAVPAKTGYDQTAPYWDKDGKNITADTVITAVYTINKYTVSFDANGGIGTMDDVIAEHGEYTLPANSFTAPSWKKFKAWSVDGVEKGVGTTITVTSDTTVKAVWENTYVYNVGVYVPTTGGVVESAKTFDSGIALYIGMSILSATGSVWMVGKKRK